MNTAYEAAGVVLGILALLGGGAAIVRWFFNRGGAEREVTIALQAHGQALKDNTSATRELSGRLDEVGRTIHSLDIRVTRLEAAPIVTVAAPSHRDASTDS